VGKENDKKADKMTNKKENVKGKKYDKFAIWSFVFAVIGILSMLLSFIYVSIMGLKTFNGFILFLYSVLVGIVLTIILDLISIILGIISLRRIKNNPNIKGRILALMGLFISSITTIFLIIDFIINKF